jgi:hypothetical protein
MRLSITLSLTLLALAGCANKEGVSPSQNPTLNAVSKSSAAADRPGFMQRTLDDWLKEEWNPIMATEATTTTKTESDGTVITTKTEPTKITVSTQGSDGSTVSKTTNATQITTTKKSSDGTVSTSTEVVPLDEDNTPFTLQKYADKWKEYLEKKAKMNEGKPKEPSHVEQMEALPVIGK